MEVIRTEKLSKIFHQGQSNEIKAVNQVNIEVQRGECILLKGPSGSGKSTLLAMLACLSRPTEGAYYCMGEQVSRWSEKFLTRFRQQHIGVVFQHFNLIKGLSASDNIGLPLVPYGLSQTDIQRRIAEVANLAGISHRLHALSEQLSGGEQQRVAIARALAGRPELLFADEPTAHLDRANAEQILSVFELLKQQGKTLVITSHDPLLMSHPMVSRSISLRDGEVLPD
jgi:putative ABC transport system ATP-binding protein